MWRWFRWVLLGAGIIIVIILTVLSFYYFYWIKMPPKMIQEANAAFEKGITIDDAKNDFVMLGVIDEIPRDYSQVVSDYKKDYLDIRSVSLGADEKYLYYKYTFYGMIPKTADYAGSDPIVSFGAKAELVDNSGKEIGGMDIDFGYVPIVKIPSLNESYFYGPTGIEWPESARYTGQGNDGRVYGGGGTNYIMGAFPLSVWNLKYGSTIGIRFPMEVESAKFTHAAMDILQGSGKSPGIITWTLGTNTYQINNNNPETTSQKEN